MDRSQCNSPVRSHQPRCVPEAGKATTFSAGRIISSGTSYLSVLTPVLSFQLRAWHGFLVALETLYPPVLTVGTSVYLGLFHLRILAVVAEGSRDFRAPSMQMPASTLPSKTLPIH